MLVVSRIRFEIGLRLFGRLQVNQSTFGDCDSQVKFAEKNTTVVYQRDPSFSDSGVLQVPEPVTLEMRQALDNLAADVAALGGPPSAPTVKKAVVRLSTALSNPTLGKQFSLFYFCRFVLNVNRCESCHIDCVH